MTKHSIEKMAIIYVKSKIYTFSYKHYLWIPVWRQLRLDNRKPRSPPGFGRYGLVSISRTSTYADIVQKCLQNRHVSGFLPRFKKKKWIQHLQFECKNTNWMVLSAKLLGL